MNVSVIGAGLMGSAISYDVLHETSIDTVTLIDNNQDALKQAEKICKLNALQTKKIDIKDEDKIKDICSESFVIISAVPYFFNEMLTKIAIENSAHFIDLGGNNDVVHRQKSLHDAAVDKQVTIIPDLGLAPGLVSIITKDIVETYSDIEYVKLRVGGLPVNPKPPLEYEIVFSPNGLINEYLEDAIVLDHGKSIIKNSMSEIEPISFPEPFENMEAFITSGGCSTLPTTYKNVINYLGYKTIRYPGHCEKFKTMLDLGFGSTNSISVHGSKITPREILIHQLEKKLPRTGDDVILLKVYAKARKNDDIINIEYSMIDYMDKKSNLSAMMRTTGFPVSITADFLAKDLIKKPGVFCPEEIIPTKMMFTELKKRNINIEKIEEKV